MCGIVRRRKACIGFAWGRFRCGDVGEASTLRPAGNLEVYAGRGDEVFNFERFGEVEAGKGMGRIVGRVEGE